MSVCYIKYNIIIYAVNLTSYHEFKLFNSKLIYCEHITSISKEQLILQNKSQMRITFSISTLVTNIFTHCIGIHIVYIKITPKIMKTRNMPIVYKANICISKYILLMSHKFSIIYIYKYKRPNVH